MKHLMLMLAGVGAMHASAQAQVADDTIIVTGQKLEQSLLDTPSSVIVATSTRLDQPFYTDVADFLRRIPNVQFDSAGNLPFVRGLDGSGVSSGGGGAVTGGRPRITTYVDGVPRGFSFLPNGVPVTWDIDQLEFYRGAQSTAIGRNALAGAIVVQTKDPVDRIEGAAQVGVRSQEASVSGAITANLPLVADRLALRVSADGYTGDNFVDYGGPLASREDFLSRDEGYRLRAKLLFKPNGFGDDFSLRLAYEKQHARRPSPEDLIDLVTFPDPVSTDPFSISAFELNSEFVSLEANVPLGDGWSLYAIGSYLDALERGLPVLTDGSSLDVFAASKELTGEARITYAPDASRLRAVAGVFVFDRNRDEGGTPGSAFVYSADDQGSTLAAFADAVLPFGPIDILAGARWERERQDRSFSSEFGLALDFDRRQSIFLPKGGVRWHIDDQRNLTALYYRGYSPGAAGVSFVSFEPYDFARETSDNIELAFRGAWPEAGLSVNVNVFANWLSDQQIFANGPLGPFDTIVINAARTRLIGIEADARMRVSPLITVNLMLGILDAQIIRFGDQENDVFDGNELPYAPAFTSLIGLELNPLKGFSATADIRYTSAYESDFRNVRADRVGNDWLVDMRLRYDMGSLSLFGYVENLFDAVNPTNRSTEFGTAYLNRPRTFGGGLRVRY